MSDLKSQNVEFVFLHVIRDEAIDLVLQVAITSVQVQLSQFIFVGCLQMSDIDILFLALYDLRSYIICFPRI
jgi:hypothetical protein